MRTDKALKKSFKRFKQLLNIPGSTKDNAILGLFRAL